MRRTKKVSNESGNVFSALQVNDKSGVPVWIQIRNHMIFLIRSGQLRPGDVLPTVRDLAVRLGVNYNTIHKVYQDLETDGLISSGRGRRSTIADVDPSQLSSYDSPVDAIIEELVRVVRESGIPEEEALMRVKEALSDKG